ncbi:hypothetical protein [Streptomyces sp. NPDC057257]|uniref:hypothetical protein n=1 Tax=Streptomyces sp. NPDC057257 TaxID=3346071 RepID=UPI00362BC5B4
MRSLTDDAAVDLVFDGVGVEIGKAATPLVEPGGRFIVHGAAGGTFNDVAELAARGVTVISLSQMMDEHAGDDGCRAGRGRSRTAAAGGADVPFGACGSHAAVEARGTVGRTLLLV